MRLNWQATLTNRGFRRLIAEAREKHDQKAVDELRWEEQEEDIIWHEEREGLYTRQLLRQAGRLHVPVPRQYDDKGQQTDLWVSGDRTGTWYLTDEGVEQLRGAIREELRWRIERRGHWINWVAALTGLIGALTGLVAMLLVRR